MRRISIVLGLLGLSIFWGGCASTMMIFTEPGDAEILVEGEMVGRSPVLYAGNSGVGGAVEVTARLPGYQEQTVEVSRIFEPWGWYLPDAVHIPLESAKE